MPTTGVEKPMATRSSRDPDGICAAAVEPARSAAVEIGGPDQVGDHLEAVREGDRVVTHLFVCTARGYRGWRWAVTLARAPRARSASVSEVALLPGPEAILAPEWVPWSDRIAPGDLGPADVLPYRDDDPLLEPGFVQLDDQDEDRLAIWELGLGRPRVLSPLGRREAANRWYHGDRGPTAEEAVNAAAACATCGYFLPLAGGLRAAFGVCANEWSPSDARVVSVDHGCGAHSETDLERGDPPPLPEPILDELGADWVDVGPADVAPDVEPAVAAVAEAELDAEAEPEAEAESRAEPEAPVVAEAEPPTDPAQ